MATLITYAILSAIAAACLWWLCWVIRLFANAINSEMNKPSGNNIEPGKLFDDE